MATRRNSSGSSSSGRRGSSRPNSGGRSYKAKENSTGRPDRKSNSVPGKDKPYTSGPRKSFRKKDDEPGKSFSKNDRREGAGKEKSTDRKFKKGPSFGLPYKRTYGKKKSSGEEKIEKTGRFGAESGKTFARSERNVRRPRKNEGEQEPRGFFKKSKSRYNERPRKTTTEESAPAQTEKIRLNKYISNSGVCSRREADELISMGLVSVNGKTITELGYKVNPGDEVRYENKVLKAEKHVYVLMNKPKGYLTTTDDPQERNTVMHIIGSAVKERIYPVGRLDRNTTGLLLLTNDGDLADKLMHPSYNAKKIYKVELDKPLTKADFQKISEGVLLEEGRAVVDDLAMVSDDGKTIGVEIHIGWNRVVRRIFENLGYAVVRLDRSVYAGLDKKNLSRGHWRFLTKEEIVRLKHYL